MMTLRQVVEPLDAPGGEDHRVPGGGQRLGGGGADARGRAGDDGRAALGVGFEAGHQRTFTEVGSDSKPRTLTEWTRRVPAGSIS